MNEYIPVGFEKRNNQKQSDCKNPFFISSVPKQTFVGCSISALVNTLQVVKKKSGCKVKN